MKLLFCHIPWAESYDGTEGDFPETENFLPAEIEGENGETVSLLLGTVSGVSLLDLSALASGNEPFASGVTVVFCAEAPNGAEVCVGWYENANVTARKECMAFSDEDGSSVTREFFFCTREENAVLLPPEDRYSFLPIPRNRAKAPGKFGFSKEPVWYAKESAAKAWLSAANEKIASYDGDNLLYEEEEDI